MNRRKVLGFGLLAAAVPVLAACTTGSTQGAPAASSGSSAASGSGAPTDAFPVTIKHALGETVIEKAPTRPAGVGWGSGDLSLLYGVVPVGVPAEAWGGDEHKSMPWVTAKLDEMGAGWDSAKAPKQYSTADGVPFVEIAKLNPDIIIAVHSGITEDDYKKLSEIAPTVAYKKVPWGTPWQDATTMVGQAFGQSAKAQEIVSQTDQLLKDQQKKYPEMEGKTFISAAITPGAADPLWLYGVSDQRSYIMEDLGMKVADVVVKAGEKTDGIVLKPFSPERASELDSQVLVNWIPGDKSTTAAIAKDPLLGQIPAVKAGTLVSPSSVDVAYSLTVGTPLGLEWGVPKLVPDIAAAAKKK